MVAAGEVKMGGIDVVYDIFQRQFYQDIFPDNLLTLNCFEDILKNDVAKRSVQRKGRMNDYMQRMRNNGVEKNVG